MSYNEERGFDEMIHKAIPYLLFCYDDQRNIIANLLRSMFDSIPDPQPASFKKNYDALDQYLSYINLEPERKTHLVFFETRYHSLEKRLNNHDDELRIALDGLDSRLKAIETLFPRTKGGLKGKIESIESRLKDKRKTLSTISTPEIICPNCGKTWPYKGKARRINCPDCGCFRNREFYKVKGEKDD